MNEIFLEKITIMAKKAVKCFQMLSVSSEKTLTRSGQKLFQNGGTSKLPVAVQRNGTVN